jgi:hypothetical protein
VCIALKSSSTEYNFYNSDESRGQSISSSSSNMQQFKKTKDAGYYNNSLEIVKEASNNAIEEDLDEDSSIGKLASASEKAQNEGNKSTSSASLEKSDIEKVIDFMKDLTNRSEMIYSFYEETQTLEVHEQELELAYLLNKICYDLKVFITTFSSSKDIKDDTGLQIISENGEKVDISESLIQKIKSSQEFKNVKNSVGKLK